MKIRLSKSAFLVQGVPDHVTISDIALDVIQTFCYLGSNVAASGSLYSELDARIAKAASRFGKFRFRAVA